MFAWIFGSSRCILESKAYLEQFEKSLELLRKEGRYRVFAELHRPVHCFPNVIWRSGQDERHIVTWCSNDYLGMSHHPVVRQAMHDAIDSGATGAGGTRNISGTHRTHVQLEATLASLHNAPAALTFTSGYVANLTTLATLGQLLPGLVILSDAYGAAWTLCATDQLSHRAAWHGAYSADAGAISYR
jgi:5-aminolevulinate synthase